MSTPRVVLAPQLLQKLPSKKQFLSCTNLVGENVRESGTPGEATTLRAGHAQSHRLRTRPARDRTHRAGRALTPAAGAAGQHRSRAGTEEDQQRKIRLTRVSTESGDCRMALG